MRRSESGSADRNERRLKMDTATLTAELVSQMRPACLEMTRLTLKRLSIEPIRLFPGRHARLVEKDSVPFVVIGLGAVIKVLLDDGYMTKAECVPFLDSLMTAMGGDEFVLRQREYQRLIGVTSSQQLLCDGIVKYLFLLSGFSKDASSMEDDAQQLVALVSQFSEQAMIEARRIIEQAPPG